MRWPIIRLIAGREIRDQFRDRRTIFLIFGLPVLMYPLFIGVGILFITVMKEKKLVVGVVGESFLPQEKSPDPAAAPSAVAGVPAGCQYAESRAYPPLIVNGKFLQRYLTDDPDGATLIVKPFASADESILAQRQADALLIVEDDFLAKLERGDRPIIRVTEREGEENSKLAVRRLVGVLHKWNDQVRAVRFARAGLPANFDSPIEIKDPLSEKPLAKKVIDELRDALVKVIPFLLMMWMLTGAVYPAIDMTAGEKERGTMETLLISPAERVEIVLGKFTAVVCMGFGTAMWNVVLMLIAVAVAPQLAPIFAGQSLLSLPGLGACILAAIPLAMLIGACGLSLGVFARSTKEGNYYMVPMFFVALPLSYVSMSPGIELGPATSWIPITNALLLQQRLLAVRTDPFPWQHIPAVIASLALCISLALWAAVRQFQRESVLFREAEAGKKKWSMFGAKDLAKP
jgi:sodium transport system permease protein